MANCPLNLIDAAWLLVESSETPMHVGALLPIELPEGAGPEHVRAIIDAFRATPQVVAPWNRRLHTPRLKSLVPLWTEVDAIDIDHHIHHSALPAPGGERELGQLIARLHSQPLDLTRPPWEVEIIEGLEGGRIAMYAKVHHSLMDGIAGVRMLVHAMSARPEDSLGIAPFWANPPKRARPGKAPASVAQIAAQLMDGARGQVGSLSNIVRAFGAMAGAVYNKDDVLAIPFDTPMSILNGRIRGPRRFATQRLELSRMKEIARHANSTLNDVLLALCGSALRRFLLELDELPEKSLTAGIPASVRPSDENEQGADAGNAITFMISTLGTDLDDPLERLNAIRASTRRAKEHVQSLPRKAMAQYTLLLMAPYMASLLTGVGGRTRPMFNITISNVPGPEQPLYFQGAKLQAIYPASLVTHGQALNITCNSYDGYLHFGITGCRDSLPHMQRLAPYIGEALVELEQAIAQPARAARRKPTAPRKRPPTPAKRKETATAKRAKGGTAAKVTKTVKAATRKAASKRSTTTKKAASRKAAP